MSVSLSNIAVASVTTSKARKWDHLSDARRKPPKSACIYRVGPAPREEVLKDGEGNADIGTLDEDMDSQNLIESSLSKVGAASKALIIYFSKMAKKGSKETVDFRFLESLIIGGANVNVADKHGQTVMHEVARNWNVDVAKFFIDFGANVNQTDKWGRSPLHLASAVDHFEMVKYLINNLADIHKKTHGEHQTAIHYAAKYNAVGSLKILIENRANLCDKDYKNRTPLYIAAETAQEDSTRYLVDLGAPVGVFDDTGMSAICIIVEKMPHVALDALNQFIVNDPAYRKNCFYLNYLESNPINWSIANEQVDQYGIPIVSGDKKVKKKIKNCPINALKAEITRLKAGVCLFEKENIENLPKINFSKNKELVPNFQFKRSCNKLTPFKIFIGCTNGPVKFVKCSGLVNCPENCILFTVKKPWIEGGYKNGLLTDKSIRDNITRLIDS